MSSRADRRRSVLAVLLLTVFLVLLPGVGATAQEAADGTDATGTTAGQAVRDVLPLPQVDRPGPDGSAQVGSPTQLDAEVVVPAVPEIRFEGGDEGLSRTVSIVLAIGIASLAPALVLLATTFTRYIVVLSLVKNALALQTVPPAQVLVGLALFLTAFTMGPTLSEVNEVAVQPLLAGEVDQSVAWEDGFEPMKQFMLAQVHDEDLELFIELSAEADTITSREDVPALTLVPAFIISELRTAFTIGFMVFVPFLLIDLVVAVVLMSMGMVMVPPVFISLPLKLLLFVLVDGWVLLIGALVQSVNPVVVALPGGIP